MLASSPMIDLPRSPLLKSNVIRANLDGGIYFELGESSFFLGAAPSLQAAIDRILPLFDGRHSAGDIVRRLPPPVLPVFHALTRQLVRHAMLTEGPPVAPGSADPFASTRHFMQSRTPAWEACFASWARRPITLDGPEEFLLATAAALVGAGAQTVNLTPGREAERALRALHAMRIWAPGCAPVSTGVAEPGAAGRDDRPLLLVFAGFPDEGAARRIDRLATRHASVVIGHAGRRITISPELTDASAWLRLVVSAGDAGPVPPATVREIAYGLIAMDALAGHVALWSDAAGSAARGQAYRTVERDGAVLAHQVAEGSIGGAASAEPAAAPPPGPVASPPPARVLSRSPWTWRAAGVGALRDAEARVPPFPLPHWAVEVRMAAYSSRILDWGVDPDDARERATALAVARIALAQAGRGEGEISLVAARSFEALELIASQHALAARAPDRLRTSRLAAERLCGADVQMLVRLARLYLGGLPQLDYWRCGDGGAAWAEGSGWTCVGIGVDPDAAAAEAVGGLISAIQCDALPCSQQRWLYASLRNRRRTVVEDPPAEKTASDSSTGRYRGRVTLLDELQLPGGWLVGYAETEPA